MWGAGVEWRINGTPYFQSWTQSKVPRLHRGRIWWPLLRLEDHSFILCSNPLSKGLSHSQRNWNRGNAYWDWKICKSGQKHGQNEINTKCMAWSTGIYSTIREQRDTKAFPISPPSNSWRNWIMPIACSTLIISKNTWVHRVWPFNFSWRERKDFRQGNFTIAFMNSLEIK